MTDRSRNVEETLPPGTRLEEFVIEQGLQSGGFGVTYLAQDESLGRRVAIKEYLPLEWAGRRADGSVGPRSASQAQDYEWGLARFLDEARMLARLDHGRIVRVYRVIEAWGTAYMMMEYVAGRNLEEALKAEGPWPEERVRGLLESLLPGVALVHEAGLVHRDIKPSNVMLRSDGTPVLIDFGAARYAAGVHSRSLTSVLTPGYAPDEQYHTAGKQGPWTDVYALGAVAYRALSGHAPVEAPARVHEIAQRRSDPLAPVASASAGPVSESFGSAVTAALAVWPEGRPPDVGAWRAWWDGGSVVRPSEEAEAGAPSELFQEIGRRSQGSWGDAASAWARWFSALPERAWTGAGAIRRGLRRLPAAVRTGVVNAWARWLARERRVAYGATVLAGAAAVAFGVVKWGGNPESAPASRVVIDPPGVSSTTGGDDDESEPPAAASVFEEPPMSPLAPDMEYADGEVFRDCEFCPEMVVIPAGAFMMGSVSQDPEAFGDEKPQHRVSVGRFALGLYEVTREEYAAFALDSDGTSWREPGFAQGDDHPVVHITWPEAQTYAERLSQETGASYRLPSESEWEYAVRAGTTTRRYWGDSSLAQCEYANGWEAVASCDDGWVNTAPAGSFKANAFGLFDMLGNVSEWTADCYSRDVPPVDGSAWVGGGDCSRRVLRGGSYGSHPRLLRSANRRSLSTGWSWSFRSIGVGFRVARTLD